MFCTFTHYQKTIYNEMFPVQSYWEL